MWWYDPLNFGPANFWHKSLGGVISHEMLQLRLVCRWSLLLLLAGVRCVYSLSEQPSSSLMPRFDYIKYVKTCLKTILGCPWNEIPLPEPQMGTSKSNKVWDGFELEHVDKFPIQAPYSSHRRVTWVLMGTSLWSRPSAGAQRQNLRCGLRSFDRKVHPGCLGRSQ